MIIANQNIALILKLVDSKFFQSPNKERKTTCAFKPNNNNNKTKNTLVRNLYFNLLGVKISFTPLFSI